MSQTTHDFFQYAVIGFFIFLAIVGTVFFALTRATGTGSGGAPVVVWGPDLGGAMQRVVNEYSGDKEILSGVSYVAKQKDALYQDLVEAIASGNGPDAVIFDARELLAYRDKITPISYATYPAATFSENFVDGASLLTDAQNVYALPIAVDPLVMFWNKDLFASAGVPSVPVDWENFVRVMPSLAEIRGNAEVARAAVAFGEYDNVSRAKEIVSTLLMQAGAKITTRDNTGFIADLGSGGGVKNTELALRFYTDFSNPIKTVYSWNKTFELSRDAFAHGKVALAGGLASDRVLIAKTNPNLSFGIASWPQSAGASNKVTYGTFYAIAVLKSSKNPSRAFSVAQIFSGAELSQPLAKALGFPSARRGFIPDDPSDPFGQTIVRSVAIPTCSFLAWLMRWFRVQNCQRKHLQQPNKNFALHCGDIRCLPRGVCGILEL
jgi:ABC-type glycerol-3-phosphate transport system substrate-binding protein